MRAVSTLHWPIEVPAYLRFRAGGRGVDILPVSPYSLSMSPYSFQRFRKVSAPTGVAGGTCSELVFTDGWPRLELFAAAEG